MAKPSARIYEYAPRVLSKVTNFQSVKTRGQPPWNMVFYLRFGQRRG